MSKMDSIIDIVNTMRSSTIKNYVIAGLDSSLLGNGKVRLFENARNHQDSITPHSHRFDFCCLVLCGQVINRIWTPSNEQDGDFFQESSLTYLDEVGKHDKKPEGLGFWSYADNKYLPGETYSMLAEEVHSIYFSRGAKVLFFEGPTKRNESKIIEPVVAGDVIETYKNESYMFKKVEQ